MTNKKAKVGGRQPPTTGSSRRTAVPVSIGCDILVDFL
jgi:hypothetical protein